MEAAVQPEDHSGGSPVHQQPQRLVAVRRLAEAAQGHEQHPRPQTEERAGQLFLFGNILIYVFIEGAAAVCKP